MRARPNLTKLLRSYGLTAATKIQQGLSSASAAHANISANHAPLFKVDFFNQRSKELAQQLLSQQISSLVDHRQHVTHRKD